jgi:hypothetical protein
MTITILRREKKPPVSFRPLFACALLLLSSAATAAANPTAVENLNAGDQGWKEVANIAFPSSFDSMGYIKGYASATSVNTGESITLYVSVNNPADRAYSVSIYRLGGCTIRYVTSP